MAKQTLKTQETKINVKSNGWGYEALVGGNSEAMLLHLVSDTAFPADELEYWSKQASVHGWQIVVR